MRPPGSVYFFTGLSGAGKTTIGSLFFQRLRAKRPDAVFLDGDAVRRLLAEGHPLPVPEEACRDLLENAHLAPDYTRAGRLRGAQALFRLCRALAEQGRDVVCCSISMFRQVRRWNRENIPNYREIYIQAPWEVLRARDRKGLYAPGAVNVMGVDIPAEEPEAPDLVIRNDGSEAPEAIAARLAAAFGL